MFFGLTLGNLGTTERLLNDHITTLGAKCHTDSLGQDIHTLEHRSPAFIAEQDILVCCVSTDLGVACEQRSGCDETRRWARGGSDGTGQHLSQRDNLLG